MNQQIAEQWAAELESGKWNQTMSRLRDEDGFCCIGVLTELAKRAGINPGTVEGGAYFTGAIGGEAVASTFPEIAAIIREHAATL